MVFCKHRICQASLFLSPSPLFSLCHPSSLILPLSFSLSFPLSFFPLSACLVRGPSDASSLGIMAWELVMPVLNMESNIDKNFGQSWGTREQMAGACYRAARGRLQRPGAVMSHTRHLMISAWHSAHFCCSGPFKRKSPSLIRSFSLALALSPSLPFHCDSCISLSVFLSFFPSLLITHYLFSLCSDSLSLSLLFSLFSSSLSTFVKFLYPSISSTLLRQVLGARVIEHAH